MVIGPNFVFIAVPRTASQSLTYHWLPNYGGVSLGPDDYHRTDVPPEHAHKFTFAVVRNPYDRWMSLWYLLQKFSSAEREKISMWDGMSPADLVRWCREHQDAAPQWRNQDRFLSDARMDRVLRYEALHWELLALPFVGCPDDCEPLPKTNCTDNPGRVIWDLLPSFIQAVNDYWPQNFERFGYERLKP